MYFPTDSEENQDETTAIPAGLQKLNSPLAGFGVQPLPYPRLGLNGIPSTGKPIVPNQVVNTATPQPDTTPKLSLAQRIAALGEYPFSESFSSNNQNAEGTPKVGIGHRIMGTIGQQPDPWAATRLTPLPNTTPEMWRSRPQPLPAPNPLQPARTELLNGKPSTSSFNNGQRYGEFFSSFVPAGANLSANRSSTEGQRGFAGFSTQLPTLEVPGNASNSASPQLFSDFLPRSLFYSRADRSSNVPSASSAGEQLGKTMGTIPSGMQLAGLTTGLAATAMPFGKAQRSQRKEGPPQPPLGGSVGRGAKNDVADVRQVQQFLNLAIDNEELSGPKIPEDGKITDRMLEMIDQYQQFKKLPKQQVIDRNSITARALAQNPLWDARWSQYDNIIKKEVDYYNNLFQKTYPQGFQPLDWRRVKAMLWTEVHGPDFGNGVDWQVWPMQIGKNKADPGMRVVKYGLENTYRYVPKELRDKLKHQKMTGELNIRAGIAYLYDRGIGSWQTEINDPAVRTYQLKPGDTLEGLAKRLGTTVAELKQQNSLDQRTARALRAGQILKFRPAHEIPEWRDWPTASFLYNSGKKNANYGKEVEGNYLKIQRRW